MSAHWFVPQRATKLILLHQIELIPHILFWDCFPTDWTLLDG